MGIPSYYSYIVKNYPNIIKAFIQEQKVIHNLYLDSNSIIYDVYGKLLKDRVITTTTLSQSSIITAVISKIQEYITLIKPTNQVIVAFDGVAPRAKLEQQRNRRYKSWYQSEVTKQILGHTQENEWNTASITPGTQFMNTLNQEVTKYFNQTKSSQLGVSHILVSGSNIVGEGEHKIFEHIRKNPTTHNMETTMIYGLDADLIMLSINHLPICPNIYLFRETPEFIKSIDSSLEPNANYYLDIHELTTSICNYMGSQLYESSETTESLETTINTVYVYDYIFLCFFLGNDFLPHFPAINIRTGGIDKMINAYKMLIGKSTTSRLHLTQLNHSGNLTICWEQVRRLVQILANLEEDYFIKEHRQRNFKENYDIPDTTPADKLRKFELTPTYNRDMEKYINPVKSNWQHRYYYGLFPTQTNKKNICLNYLQGLEWTMKYYTTGCPDWRWHYKYNYPPLLSDLLTHIPLYYTEFIVDKPPNPVSELVQLCYVLPKTSLDLIPNNLRFELLKNCSNWYNNDCDFTWAYCRYFWEAHVNMDTIDLDMLETIVAKYSNAKSSS